MFKAEFETTTLVDAIGKAARFAPTKGTALDKSGGIVLHFDAMKACRVMATDLDNSFVRWIGLTDLLDCDPDYPDVPVRWRVAHLPLVAVMNGLPMESGGRTILWADDEEWVHIECEKIRARLALYDPMVPYPDKFAGRFEELDSFGGVENFASKAAQVAWALDPKSEIRSGVHVTGQHLYGFNGTSLARVPLDCPVSTPVTAAVDSGLPLLRDYPEFGLRATEGELQVALDDDTQVTCRLLAGAYPPVADFFDQPVEHSIVLERSRVLAALARVTAPFVDKLPRVLVEIRGDTISFTMSSPEQGKIRDEIEHGQNSPESDLWLTPGDFRNMLEGAGEDRLELFYFAGTPSLKPIKVVDRQGYAAITMPRKP